MRPIHLATDEIPSVRNSGPREVPPSKRGKTIQPVQNGKSFIYITNNDYRRLLDLLEIAKSNHVRDRGDLTGLEAELERAVVVGSKEVPANRSIINLRA